MSRPHALLTGCSSGIGRAAALRFARAGWRVTATAREVSAIDDLAAQGIATRALDVLDPAACERVLHEAGPLDALVNNAGYGLLGPVEELSDEALRRQFEVNVFAVLRLCRLALPAMRDRGRGRVVIVGSCVGRFTYPMGGAYCATKHALESLCDAMRVEVAPFGVRVVLVQPGPIATRFKDNAARQSGLQAPPVDSPYADLTRRALAQVNQSGGWPGASPDRVARAIVRGATARRPRSRYVVTNRARALLLARWCLPDAVWDYLISKACGLR